MPRSSRRRLAARVLGASLILASVACGEDDTTSPQRAATTSSTTTTTSQEEPALSMDELVQLVCGPDELGQARVVWRLPPLEDAGMHEGQTAGVQELARLSSGCTGVKVARLPDSPSVDANWFRVTLPDGLEGWVEFDCNEEVYDDYGRCNDLMQSLPAVEPEPLATAGLPDLVLEATPHIPKAGDPCYGGKPKSTWFVVVRNAGDAATPRVLTAVAGDQTETVDDLYRGLEPGEMTDIASFEPGATVTIDPGNQVAEADETNNVVTLGPLQDPNVACL